MVIPRLGDVMELIRVPVTDENLMRGVTDRFFVSPQMILYSLQHAVVFLNIPGWFGSILDQIGHMGDEITCFLYDYRHRVSHSFGFIPAK
jgi:hypothetical protein